VCPALAGFVSPGYLRPHESFRHLPYPRGPVPPCDRVVTRGSSSSTVAPPRPPRSRPRHRTQRDARRRPRRRDRGRPRAGPSGRSADRKSSATRTCSSCVPSRPR
jgi:hypothetical protein